MKVFVLLCVAILAVGVIAFILSQQLNQNSNTNRGEETVTEDQNGQDRLYSVCATAEIPQTELDTTLDAENKVVVVRWWDEASQKNKELRLPYEPETGFAGCSPSAKTVLRHIQETQSQVP